MNSQTFGEQIRRLREEKKLSIRQVAAQIDFDQSSYSKVERNELVVPQRLIRSIANTLGASYKDLQIKYLSERLFYELKDQDYALEAIELSKRRLETEHQGTRFQVQREKLIQRIREYLSGQPVEKAWIFGSFARNEEGFDSDVDILVRFMKPNKIDLFEYVGMKQDLEELTGRQVDLVEEGFLIPQARGRVEKEKILIYERQTGNGGTVEAHH